MFPTNNILFQRNLGYLLAFKRYFGRPTVKSCNEHFFKHWSPQMAYWLGMLFADGCVTQGKLKLRLRCTDGEHVHKFKNQIQSTYAISNYLNGRNIMGELKYCITEHNIINKVLLEDLAKLGCVERKSLILKWPNNLPSEFENHFVRGYFDGDGCLSISGQIISVKFCGTYLFLYKLQHCINSHIQQTAKGSIVKNRNLHVLAYGGNSSPMNVANWMYENSEEEIRLKRKFALLQKIPSIIENAHRPKERVNLFKEYKASEEWQQYVTCPYHDTCPQKRTLKN